MRHGTRLTIAFGVGLALVAMIAPAARADFGLLPGAEGLSAVASAEGGGVELRAGAHPVELRTEINFKLAGDFPGEPGVPFSDGDLRSLEIDLPPGLVENSLAVPRCTQADFQTPRDSPFEESLAGENCPARTQVGTVTLRTSYGGGSSRTFGVFNLAPPPGAPSELGFNAYGAPFTFLPRIRQADGEYGLTLVARNVSQVVDLNGISLAIWGTPWSLLHNSQRGNCLNEAEPGFGWAKCSPGPPRTNRPVAYLTLPTSCAAPLAFTLRAESWQEPDRTVTRTYDGQQLGGCSALPFSPSPAGFVTNPRASSPSGFDFNLDVDNGGFLEPKKLAPSPVRTAVVKLPDGITINPSVGSGLGSCDPGQYASESVSSPPGAGCPNESKIGDFRVNSPILDETVEGSVFLATPYRNPFGSLLGVYLVAKAPNRGVLVKVAGKLDADPATGSLVATFENLPQLPYTNLRVHFREGQRSPLATPGTCGDLATQIDLSAWRSPGTVLHKSFPFTIGAGVGGGPCPGSTPGFAPTAEAGSVNSSAGFFSPFYLRLSRADTEQEITSYSASLPPGLTGKLAGVPFCPEAAIEAAKVNGGFAEARAPSCPVASSIGRTVAGYGVGPVLNYAPGGLYLAGPFHGSTFSVVAIDSATVGPFDLGTVVVRSAIEVDPQTAQVTIDSAGSDPIPHILDGIPIHLRDLRVYLDRPEFTLNPTSCQRFAVTSTLTGSGAVFGNPADDTVAEAPSPYQAFNCGGLGFKPKLSLRLKGGTRRGAFPSLRAEVRPRPGDANIASAAVTLPPSEFLAQQHIDTICTRPQFAREACPPGSVYGRARAFTPLLPVPMEGNVYLRASDHPLPDLVAALRGGGYGLAIDVVGRIDSVRGGLRGRFDVIPDAPVSKFVMRLRGGRHSLLVNSENVCRSPDRAHARFVGKNNLGERLAPRLINPRCKTDRQRHREAGR